MTRLIAGNVASFSRIGINRRWGHCIEPASDSIQM